MESSYAGITHSLTCLLADVVVVVVANWDTFFFFEELNALEILGKRMNSYGT